MRLFVNENAVKAKRSGLRWGSFQRFLKPMQLGVIRAKNCILYEQFSHKCYSLKNFS